MRIDNLIPDCIKCPLVSLLFLLLLSSSSEARDYLAARSSDDLVNPHKGWMLWGTTFGQDGGVDNFHGARIFHIYAPWRELESTDQVFDFDGFESRHLDPILQEYPDASFVLRLVADYPDGPGSGINGWYQPGQADRDYPLFLEQPPLSIGASNYASCNGDGPGRAPDWNDPNFQNQALELVSAFAQRYDGDPRITAIQVGLLGLWGEWHQSGCPTLAPGTAIKLALRDAYQNQFSQTRLQTRYSRIPDAQGVEVGFHEDYFPSFTGQCARFSPPLPQCDDGGDWNLEWGMANLVPEARDNWRLHPVSGESPLNSQQNAWVDRTADISALISDYHFSFLGPAGKHEQAGNTATLAELRRLLGYNLHLDRLTIPDPVPVGSAFSVEVEIHNSGSAPPYHFPAFRLLLLDSAGNELAGTTLAIDLGLALPGSPLLSNVQTSFDPELAPGEYQLAVEVVDQSPMRPALILQSQPRDASGRLMLGTIQVHSSGPIYANGFE